MQRQLHLREAPAERRGHGGKARNAGDHARIVSAAAQLVEHIIRRGVDGHIAEIHHGDVPSGVELRRNGVRGARIAFGADGGVARHGE